MWRHRNRRQAGHLHVVAQHRGHRLRRAGVGDVDHGRAALERERLHGQMRQRAVTDRTVVVFSGIPPEQIDEFCNRIDPQARMHDQRARLGRQHGDQREVLCRVVRKFREQQRVDGKWAAQTDADRVAVRIRLRHHLGSGIGAGAGAVLDHEGLAELLLQMVGDQPSHHVGRRAGAKRHNDPHRLGGPLLRRRRRKAEHQTE